MRAPIEHGRGDMNNVARRLYGNLVNAKGALDAAAGGEMEPASFIACAMKALADYCAEQIEAGSPDEIEEEIDNLGDCFVDLLRTAVEQQPAPPAPRAA